MLRSMGSQKSDTTELLTELYSTHQVPQSMEFSRQENWTGLSFPSSEC